MRRTHVLLSISAITFGVLGAAGCTVVNNTKATPDGGSSTTPTGTGGSGGSGGTGTTSGPDGSTTASPDSGTTPSGDGGTASDDGGTLGTDGGDTGGASADLDPPDLSNVCPGPDSYEANNSFAAAHALPLDANGRGRIGASVTQGDADYYSFVAPKHDPIWVTAKYSVSGTNTSSLSIEADDGTDTYVAGDDHNRTTPSDSLDMFWEAAAGATYAVRVNSSTDTCTPYDLYIKGLSCTDKYEDNDKPEQASPITLDAAKTASIDATISGLDEDYFQFTAPKADPITATVTYTRPANDTDALTFEVDDATNTYKAGDDTSRTTASQTLTATWEAASAGATYRLKVNASEDGICAPYRVQINGLSCTDGFEDNDSFDKAAALPSGAQNATIMNGDEDLYKLSSLPANGKCTVGYTVPSGSSQQLVIELDDATQTYLGGDDTSRSGDSQTLTASWTAAGGTPVYAKVTGGEKECTSYTITCGS